MNNAWKVCSLLLLALIIASNLTLVKPTSALSTDNSSTPSFTVQVIDDSYIIPYRNVTSTDPYTGKTSWVIEGGGHVENQKIAVTIKNPVYTPIKFPDGNVTELLYSIRTKGHYEDWQADQNHTSPHFTYAVKASNSDYTMVTYYLQGEPGWEHLLPNGGQVDVEVKAVVGYHYYYTSNSDRPFFASTTLEAFVELAEGDWSQPQTVTVPKELKNPLPDWWTGPTPEPEPTVVPENMTPIEISLPSDIPTPTPDPIGNPVSAPSQQSDNSTVFPTDWLYTAAFAALALAVALLIIFLALSRRRIKALELKQNGV
jgi:hypothetical protein